MCLRFSGIVENLLAEQFHIPDCLARYPFHLPHNLTLAGSDRIRLAVLEGVLHGRNTGARSGAITLREKLVKDYEESLSLST